MTDDRKIPTPAEMEWLRTHNYDAWLRARAFEAEREGRSIIMRDPHIKPRPPRKPSWEFLASDINCPYFDVRRGLTHSCKALKSLMSIFMFSLNCP